VQKIHSLSNFLLYNHQHYTTYPVDAISTSLEQKQYRTYVFLDLYQVFDHVWHVGLLYKRCTFLPTSLFLLIKSYLIDRYFQIRLGSCTSEMALFKAILFNVYASNQPVMLDTLVAGYADD